MRESGLAQAGRAAQQYVFNWCATLPSRINQNAQVLFEALLAHKFVPALGPEACIQNYLLAFPLLGQAAFI